MMVLALFWDHCCVYVFCNINIIMLINQSELYLYHVPHSYFLYMSLPSLKIL